MSLTYRELGKLIDAMPEERQDDTALVYVNFLDECLPVDEFEPYQNLVLRGADNDCTRAEHFVITTSD
jgi:hypothetical protein